MSEEQVIENEVVTEELENQEVVNEVLEGEEGEEKVVEAWQLEEDESEEPKEGETVPLKAHLKAKRKLKGRLEDTATELERLKKENESLKKILPETKTGKPVRPSELSFDTDEEYQEALEKYEEESFEYRLAQKTKAEQETNSQREVREKLKAGVDEHFTRAEKLLETSGITAEKYELADASVRAAVESVMPGNGDLFTDYFISQVGEGSEKVFYHLGVNKAAQEEFKNLLKADPTGVKAAIYLGKKSVQLNSPANRKSSAPPPAPGLNGGQAKDASSKLKREYDAAHKSGNYAKAFDIKREARKTHKINTNEW